jgi:hypothetical protein
MTLWQCISKRASIFAAGPKELLPFVAPRVQVGMVAMSYFRGAPRSTRSKDKSEPALRAKDTHPRAGPTTVEGLTHERWPRVSPLVRPL